MSRFECPPRLSRPAVRLLAIAAAACLLLISNVPARAQSIPRYT